MIKIFTMVKDECDIIEDWIIYHSKIFGLENIFVIDNLSTDGTYEIVQKYMAKGLKAVQYPEYRFKGLYMTELMSEYHQNEILMPIDIDEFICLFKNNVIITEKDSILNYIKNLPEHKLYKMHYILANVQDENGYEGVNALTGAYLDINKNLLKSFISAKFKQRIDHGNHMPFNDYILTDLALVHYHFRNIEQFKKKVLNNVIGLGHKADDLNYLQNLPVDCFGGHHIKNMIEMLMGTFKLNVHLPCEKDIDIKPIKMLLC